MSGPSKPTAALMAWLLATSSSSSRNALSLPAARNGARQPLSGQITVPAETSLPQSPAKTFIRNHQLLLIAAAKSWLREWQGQLSSHALTVWITWPTMINILEKAQ